MDARPGPSWRSWAEVEYLLARASSRLFALDLGQVDEILAVPALSPLAQTPSFVAGAFQLGEVTVPVIDVSRRLGLGSGPLLPEQQVVVGGGRGLLFDEVIGLSGSLRGQVAPLPDEALPGDAERFLQGMLAVGAPGIALVLDWDRLLRLPEEAPGELPAPAFAADPLLAERARLYRERALDLAEDALAEPVMVLRLGAQGALAVFARDVQEVGPVGELCPIPGCPPFVAGLLSLRGELHLAVDLRPGLGLPPAASQHFVLLREPAVALVAERVTDLVTAPVQPADRILAALPDAIVVEGCLAVGGHLVPVLATAATFARPEWVVDQQ